MLADKASYVKHVKAINKHLTTEVYKIKFDIKIESNKKFLRKEKKTERTYQNSRLKSRFQTSQKHENYREDRKSNLKKAAIAMPKGDNSKSEN